MRIARELLLACGGYESKEVEGLVMCAFERPSAAAEWALALQLALLQAPWPAQLALATAATTVRHGRPPMLQPRPGDGAAGTSSIVQPAVAEEVAEAAAAAAAGEGASDAAQQLPLFRGVRVRIGMFHGPVGGDGRSGGSRVGDACQGARRCGSSRASRARRCRHIHCWLKARLEWVGGFRCALARAGGLWSSGALRLLTRRRSSSGGSGLSGSQRVRLFSCVGCFPELQHQEGGAFGPTAEQ